MDPSGRISLIIQRLAEFSFKVGAVLFKGLWAFSGLQSQWLGESALHEHTSWQWSHGWLHGCHMVTYHWKVPVQFWILQVSGLRHDLPLCILTPHLLSHAFPLEVKSRFLKVFSPSVNNLQGSQRQFGLPDSHHNWRNCICVWPQLGLQILAWSDVAGCRLWSNDMDLPPWTLFRPLESLPAIFGNNLFHQASTISILRLECFLDMFYTTPAAGLSRWIKWST